MFPLAEINLETILISPSFRPCEVITCHILPYERWWLKNCITVQSPSKGYMDQSQEYINSQNQVFAKRVSQVLLNTFTSKISGLFSIIWVALQATVKIFLPPGGRVVPKWKPVGMNNKCSNFPLRMTKISHVSLENFQFHQSVRIVFLT